MGFLCSAFAHKVGKIPWRREMLPTPVFWPGEFLGLYSSWGHKESFSCDNKEYSWLREQVHFAQFYRKQTIFRHFIFLASYNWTGLSSGLCCIALDSSSTQLHKKSQRIFTEFIFQTTQKKWRRRESNQLCPMPWTKYFLDFCAFFLFVARWCAFLECWYSEFRFKPWTRSKENKKVFLWTWS